jgi:hypothetical protein
MGGITLAWLAGMGIIVGREVARKHQPPMPGTLLAASALFALIAAAAEYGPARPAATLLAFGLDLAAWLEAPYITPSSSKTSTAAGSSGGTAARPA